MGFRKRPAIVPVAAPRPAAVPDDNRLLSTDSLEG